MARSRALDALRRRRTYAQYEISLDDVLQEAENSFHSAYDLTGGRQRSTIVRNLLSRVDPVQRQRVFLAFGRGSAIPKSRRTAMSPLEPSSRTSAQAWPRCAVVVSRRA